MLIYCVAWVLSCCWYLSVCCKGLIVLLVFDCVLHGFIVSSVFYGVLHVVYSFVGIVLCVVWVSSCCWYLIVCCMGFLVLFI